MMIETIKRVLARDRHISDWRITETRSRSAEWYLVGKGVDTLRSVDKLAHELVVYVDSGEGESRARGSCLVAIHPGSRDAEVEAAVARAVNAAKRVSNPWFPLPEPQAGRAEPTKQSAFEAAATDSAGRVDPGSAMAALRDALYAADGTAGSRVNSLELFLTRTETRILNSRGLDARFTAWAGMTEFIVNASAPGKDEIELYRRVDFSEPDYPRLTESVRSLLVQGADRLAAVPTPDCAGMPVLFRNELAADIYGYWFSAAKARPLYEGRAPFALGESVMGEGKGGDPIVLDALASVTGSPRSRSHDADGVALAPVRCIDNGVLSRVSGQANYCHYLSVPTTGNHPVFSLAPGSATAAELASVDHLEAVAFSDFFVDPSTGDFGGELRLGYRVSGGKRIPVTGGSVTGNMSENRGLVRLSREVAATASCLAPAACLVPAARIAPAE